MILSEAAQWAVTERWKNSRRGRLFDRLKDPDPHFHVFDEKYIYPRYSELVGPTLPEHRGPDGKLTIERKAQLLLFGVFSWSGLYIAKHNRKNEHDPRGWDAVTAFDLTRPLELYSNDSPYYGKRVDDPRPRSPCTNKLYFNPFAGLAPTRLERILSRCPPDQRVGCLDGNHYNCRSGNFLLLPKMRRPKRCRNCNEEVFEGHHFAFAIRKNMILRLCNKCRASLPEAELERLIRYWY